MAFHLLLDGSKVHFSQAYALPISFIVEMKVPTKFEPDISISYNYNYNLAKLAMCCYCNISYIASNNILAQLAAYYRYGITAYPY